MRLCAKCFVVKRLILFEVVGEVIIKKYFVPSLWHGDRVCFFAIFIKNFWFLGG